MTFKRLIVSQIVLLMSLGGTALADDAAVPTASGLENAWKPKAGDEIRFNVLRKGNEFGSHTVVFEAGPDNALIAKTKVGLKAGLGPITVFRYDLSASETWRAGELVAVAGQVNDDGKKHSMKATLDGAALDVQGTVFTGEAPAEIIPASHWNYAQTKVSELLSTEDGEILKVTVKPQGRETIQAGGQSIEANRYLMDSDIDVDVWYDDQGRWVKLAFEARGQEIEYVLDQMY
ncbi:hypothetical protein HHI_10704 [Hyphomonas hirschiana VP5]|nr:MULTISPECIES: DUF6134 family protein [Hyphomonas]KCZ93148.1 hypothetical protein HHI_10704 [Hyphomonas hirschiana VP5]